MRKVLLVFLAVAFTIAALLAACAALVGPVLESRAFRRLVENSVRSLTGLTCRIDRIRFEYPFDVTARGISIEGRADGNAFSVYTRQARAVSGPASLVQGCLDDIRVQGVDLHVEMSGKAEGLGASGETLPKRPFEVPAWAWRIRRARLRSSTLRVTSQAGGSVCFEDLGIAWDREPGNERAGLIRVSLGPGGEHPADLVLRMDPTSIQVLSGPVALPALDAASLTGLAGLELPLTGTLSGAAFPIPGPSAGAEALYLFLFSDDLALHGIGPSRTGFDQASLCLGATLLMPRDGAGPAAFVDGLTASVEGLTLADGRRPVGQGLQPFALTGTLAYDTLSDSAGWTLRGRDRENNLGIESAGTLDGLLSGRRHTQASLQALCRDLERLVKELGPTISLPKGLTIQGGVLATGRLAGSLESLDFRGNLETSSLRIDLRPAAAPVPVRLEASFSGSLHGGTPERLTLETTRCEMAGTVSPRASLALDPSGISAEVAIDSADARNLASLFGPVLPRQAAGYQWGGAVDLSAAARRENRPGSITEGRFAARVRDGRFTSQDSQQMGEEIDLELEGTFHVPEALSSADLSLDASLARGKVVIGAIYGDLGKTCPRLRVDLAVDGQTRTLRIRSAGLTLQGVGTAGITGQLSQAQAGGPRGRLELKAGPVDLEALLDRVLRDGLSGRYPAVETATAAGTLEITTELDLEGGPSRVRGDLLLEGASLADPSHGLSVAGIAASLPFSFEARPEARVRPGTAPGAPTPSGTFTVEGIDFKGLQIPKVQARLQIAANRLTLEDPMRIEFAGGAVRIEELAVEGLGLGPGLEKGRAIVEMTDLDLEPVTRALADSAFEGRLNGRFDRLAIDEGAWEVKGRLGLRIRGGELRVEGIELKGPASGLPSGRCAVRAERIPLEALSRQFVEPPLKGTLDGELPAVELSDGKVHAAGSLTLSALGGQITLSEMQAGDLQRPKPFVQMDIRMKEIHLADLTAPLEVGRVSGVLQGHIRNLRVRPGFPYATAFDASLETVRRRGVPRKIDARAVETISRIGGSNQLAAVLSRGLYRYFDEYYYSKMGLQATLEDGWLELHGIRKGEQEYLVLRAFRVPTLSMPIAVLTPNQKIRFNRWLADLARVGRGRE